MFELLLPGTPVTLRGKIDAGILTTAIHAGNTVRYRVFWWRGKKRLEAWVGAEEVVAFEGYEKVKVQ